MALLLTSMGSGRASLIGLLAPNALDDYSAALLRELFERGNRLGRITATSGPQTRLGRSLNNQAFADQEQGIQPRKWPLMLRPDNHAIAMLAAFCSDEAYVEEPFVHVATVILADQVLTAG